MKRIIALLLALMMCLSLCGCGGGNTPKLSLGETVSSDLIELTLSDVQLGYFAEAGAYRYSDKIMVNLDEAYLPSDNSDGFAFFTSSKGHCLVCFDFTIKNIDRDTLDLGNYFYETNLSFTIDYDGNSFAVNGYSIHSGNDGDSRGLIYGDSAVSKNGVDFYAYDGQNILIEAGETYRIKVIGVVNFEPNDLSDPFEITAHLLNSSQKNDDFTFSVN